MVEVLVDALPDRLWRGYSDSDRVHAESFVNAGKIRLCTTRYHRSNEDKVRDDPDEGFGRLQVPGDVVTVDTQTREVTTRPGLYNLTLAESESPTYLFCLSKTQTGARHFGQTLVEVFDTQRFLDAFSAALHTLELGPERYVFRADALSVRYTKDEIKSESDLAERFRLTYAQKPSRFVPDEEYRIAVVLSDLWDGAPEALYLTLPLAGTFARFLSARPPA
jgi:hypothetical protein